MSCGIKFALHHSILVTVHLLFNASQLNFKLILQFNEIEMIIHLLASFSLTNKASR